MHKNDLIGKYLFHEEQIWLIKDHKDEDSITCLYLKENTNYKVRLDFLEKLLRELGYGITTNPKTVEVLYGKRKLDSQS